MLDQNPSYFHNGDMTTVEQVYGKVIDVNPDDKSVTAFVSPSIYA